MRDKIVIPSTSIDAATDQLKQLLTETTHRELAFFDELLHGFIIINTQQHEQIKSVKGQLVIQGKNDQSHSVPNVTVTPVETNENVTVYRLVAFVAFPKIKFEDPSLMVSFECHIETKSQDEADVTLLSAYPADRRNLLAPVKSLRDTQINVLLDSMVKDNKVDIFPTVKKEDGANTTTQKRTITLASSLPIIRILNLRVRNLRMSRSNVLSTIDLEPSSNAKHHHLQIQLDSIKYNFQRTLHRKFHHDFPLTLDLDDSFSFTFELESFEQIIYKSLIEVDCSIGQRRIKTKLLTNVDFLTQLNGNVTLSQGSLKSAALAQAIQVKFIGSRSTKLGEPFQLRARVSNTSSKSRNLVLIFNSLDSSLSDLPKIKSHIHSNLSLLKNYTSTKVKPVGVISLVNEVHFKSEPGRIFENDITLMGLQLGVYNMHGVKLVDVNTSESFSCDKYLEIIVN